MGWTATPADAISAPGSRAADGPVSAAVEWEASTSASPSASMSEATSSAYCSELSEASATTDDGAVPSVTGEGFSSSACGWDGCGTSSRCGSSSTSSEPTQGDTAALRMGDPGYAPIIGGSPGFGLICTSVCATEAKASSMTSGWTSCNKLGGEFGREMSMGSSVPGSRFMFKLVVSCAAALWVVNQRSNGDLCSRLRDGTIWVCMFRCV